MRVKNLFSAEYSIVAVMVGDTCPAEDFLIAGEDSTESARNGIRKFLEYACTHGLQGIPSAWSHEVNKEHGIYEFIKGPLRLFFFKGKNGQIAVCTGGTRKDGRKADQSSVAAAIKFKATYFEAIRTSTLEVIKDDCE